MQPPKSAVSDEEAFTHRLEVVVVSDQDLACFNAMSGDNGVLGVFDKLFFEPSRLESLARQVLRDLLGDIVVEEETGVWQP